MSSPSLVPGPDHTIYLVLADFGKHGTAFVETDPACGKDELIKDFISGQYDAPLQVIAFNVAEGWSRDVSQEIAGDVVNKARADQDTLVSGVVSFVERQLDEDVEPELQAAA